MIIIKKRDCSTSNIYITVVELTRGACKYYNAVFVLLEKMVIIIVPVAYTVRFATVFARG